jgi:hypothetical protein
MTRKISTVIGIALTVLACGIAETQGSIVTLNNGFRFSVAGQPAQAISFDTANAVTRGSTSGTVFRRGSDYGRFETNDISPLTDLRPTSVTNVLSPGSWTSPQDIRYYSFQGQTGNRGRISLDWGPGRAAQQLGGIPVAQRQADLVVLEWASNEGYVTRVSMDGGSVWSDWIYTPGRVVYPYDLAAPVADGNRLLGWATLIDFRDFTIPGVGRVPNGGLVTNVEFQSLLQGDVGDPVGSAFGALTLGGFNVQTTFRNPQTGQPFRNSGVTTYSGGTDLTADIFYVASLHSLVSISGGQGLFGFGGGLASHNVPEPASMAIWSIAGLVAGVSAIRRRTK